MWNATRNNDWELSQSERPSAAEIIFLDHRCALLSEYLTATPPGEVEKLLLPLLVTKAAKSVGVADAGLVRRIYADVLSELPHFALARACHDFLTMRAGDRWMPDTGEIFQRADGFAKPYRKELAQIRAVLEFVRGKKIPRSNRVASVINSIVNNTRMDQQMGKRELAVPLECDPVLPTKYRDKPPKLSTELRNKLGCVAQEVAAE
jgi:hypothetical protein